jgi:hypothetical protein
MSYTKYENEKKHCYIVACSLLGTEDALSLDELPL